MKFEARRTWLFFLFVTLASLWFSGYVQREIRTFYETSVRDFYDFRVFYTAGLVAGSPDTDKRLYSYKEIPDPADASRKIVVNPQFQSPESDTTYGQIARATGSDGQYLYPPFFSLAVIPLTNLPFEKAKILWHVLIFLLAGASVFLTVRLLTDDLLSAALITGISVIILEFTLPMQDLLFGANVSSLVLVFSVAGIYLHKKYPSFGALCFALAVIIKLTPVVVVPLMIVRKQWRWLGAFAVWSLLLWGTAVWQLGWQNHQEFLARVMPAMSQGVPHLDNRSLGTFFYVVYTGGFLTYEDIRAGKYIFPAQTPLLIFKAFTVISFFGLLFYFWRKNKTDAPIHAEMFCLLLWSLVFSPVSLRYGYLLAVAPFVFAWIHPLTKKATAFRLGLLSIATFTVFSVLPSYALVMANSFALQLALFMTMPIGVMMCLWYSTTLLAGENNELSENS